MLAEALIAALVGAAALWLVLQPLIAPRPPTSLALEPLDPEETPKGVALTALKEIEFDRETGKLSDADYELLKAKYTTAALEAMRGEPVGAGDIEAMIAHRARALRSADASMPPACATCGPRPEPDALYCSSCGQTLSLGALCGSCGTRLAPGGRFCEGCGTQVAA